MLAALAQRQEQVVAGWQAEKLGIPAAALARASRERAWGRLLRGVYLGPGCPETPERRMIAALLACESDAAGDADIFLSHEAAAFCWGLVDSVEFPVHVLSAAGRHIRREGIVCHRYKDFDPALHGMLRRARPVTNVEWTITCLAGVLTASRLERIIATAHRKRLTTRDQILDVRVLRGRFPGCARLDRVLAQTGMSHSELEKCARALLATFHPQPHPRPFQVLDEDGRLVAEVDIAFAEEKVAVEIDGPHHDTPDQRRADEDRRQRLEALGWRIVRADEYRLTRQPKLFVRQVLDALAAARNAR